MATTKKPAPSVDGAGTILSTVGGPADAPPPNSLGSKNPHAAQLLEKVVTGQVLAAGTAFNANKDNEYGPASTTPQAGQTVEPLKPSTTASSASETQASPKTGSGKPVLGNNPANTSLDRSRVDSTGQMLTTNQGVPVADNQSSLKIGLRGPTALEDFILREKITHFDHERIPERVVHARGSAAHGYFECYKALHHLTRAAPFAQQGKRTPVFVRFSTVAGERGSTDLARDVRGFAVKFYTDEGNWDLVGNNMPVFFIQDAIKFPDLIHAVKPEPHNGMPQAASAHDTFWDFASLMPEITHMLMWVMSDRALPRSYSTMQGFGVHTFRLINAEGASVFCKFHWNPVAGTHSVVWDEAVQISGADPDFHRRDLWEAIEAGNYPEWELALQVFTEEQAEAFEFDVLDSTKLIPEELVPLLPVGKMILNRNPDNFFAETEQVAFCTQHVVPGIDHSNDPLLQGRNHSYLDTQISRLGGPNFHQIPINASLAQVHNNQRDAMHQQGVFRGRVAYEPNSLGGGAPFQAGAAGYTSFPQPIEGDKVRGKPEKFAEHYAQARLFWISQSGPEQQHIINAFRFELTRVQVPAIRSRIVSMLENVDMELATRLADGLGIALPEPMPKASPLPEPVYAASPALSLLARPGETGVRGKKVALLVGPGADAATVRTMYASLLADGAVPRLVGSRMGQLAAGTPAKANGNGNAAPLDVEQSLETAPPVLFDGVVIAEGPDSVAQLLKDARALDFVKMQYRHGKPVFVGPDGVALINAAGLPPYLPGGDNDPGMVHSDASDLATAIATFKTVLAGPRIFARETDPPMV
jgi:catalase